MTNKEEAVAFYTVQEFADKLNIHPNTVRRSIKSGRIMAFKIGSSKKSPYRIPHSEIERVTLFDLEEMIEKIINERVQDGKTTILP